MSASKDVDLVEIEPRPQRQLHPLLCLIAVQEHAAQVNVLHIPLVAVYLQRLPERQPEVENITIFFEDDKGEG